MAAKSTNQAMIPEVLDGVLRRQLAEVSTATLTHQLQRRGIRNAFLSGLRPTRPDLRLVGRARTLRYVALREDLQHHYAGSHNAQRQAIETIEPGDVLVIEARGVPDAGTIGDVYATRVHCRGAVGVVTDGALRDTPAIAAIAMPVYHQASHAATMARQHMAYSADDGITCAGVFVTPGDILVGDGEGVVVIPAALVHEVANDAIAQEELEEFAIERVRAGDSTHDVFPLADSRRSQFEVWRTSRRVEASPTETPL